MEVHELLVSRINPAGPDVQELERLLAEYAAATSDANITMQAIREYPPILQKSKAAGEQKVLSAMPFSSARKYSMVSFAEGSFVLGAPEIVLGGQQELVSQEIYPYIKKGYRVLALGRCTPLENGAEGLPEAVTPLGYVILTNPIRQNAKETFAYFKEQGVAIKVISGDNPETVSEIARHAGIENAERFVDASMLHTDGELAEAANRYTVFGRVTPKQKQMIVKALQKAGHTVAMTGDGVNDILAMKDADCSVAMASGSEAAAQAAQVVLLDSDFAHMPSVVLEGRCVVNNIQRSASLFLVKNIFSLLMALFSAIFAFTYPLEPAQISLISMFTIGMPGFFLALEPNKKRIEGHFITNVIAKALPAGLTDVLAVGALVVCGAAFSLPDTDVATASTLLLAVVGFMILIKISHPFTPMKYAILAFSIFGLLCSGIFLGKLFAISEMSEICILLLVVFAFAAESLFRYLSLIVEKLYRWYAGRK